MATDDKMTKSSVVGLVIAFGWMVTFTKQGTDHLSEFILIWFAVWWLIYWLISDKEDEK